MRTLLLFLAFTFIMLTRVIPCIAQENGELAILKEQETQLKHKFDSLAYAENDKERSRINKNILTLFRAIVKNEQSFDYPFDSLNRTGILKSPDERVKIYNWNLPFNNGLHEYFCFIQYKPESQKEQILHFELKDKSDSITEPESAILDHPHWYGSLYYRIIPVETRFDETYYTLLAYDLNDYLTNKKIVEVLRFDAQNKPVFGASIFKNRRKVANRLIFEYGEFASMMLKYDEKKEMIVYDHLSPSSPKYEGQREFYGPDFSYDGLKYENGIWNTYYDLDLRLNKLNIDD